MSTTEDPNEGTLPEPGDEPQAVTDAELPDAGQDSAETGGQGEAMPPSEGQPTQPPDEEIGTRHEEGSESEEA